jgi:hypothetical protein
MDFENGDLIAFSNFNNTYDFGVFISKGPNISGAPTIYALIGDGSYFIFEESVYHIDNIPSHLKHSSEIGHTND